MSQRYNSNITKYIIIIPLVSLVLLSISIISIVVYNQNKHIQEDTSNTRDIYIKNQKEFIKDKVNQAIALIEYKNNLKDETPERIKELLVNRLSAFRYGKKGYIYIVDGAGKLVVHRNTKLIDSDAFSIQDPTGKYYMKDGYEVAKNSGEGFFEYISVTNKDKNWNEQKKLTFVKYYPQYDWAISAGIYTIDIDEIVEYKISHTYKHYAEQNNLLIILAIIVTLIVIAITMFLANNIAIKLKQTNLTLQTKVEEQTKELRESLGFMNKLLDIMPIPIFIKDEEFRYIKCNDAFCKFMNLSKDEIINKTVFDLSPTLLAEEYYKKDLELKTTEYQQYKHVVQRTPDTELKIVEYYKTSYQHNYDFAGILGVIIDITLQEIKKNKLKETVKEKINQNIEQTKKFEEEQLKNIKFTAIGQLAAGMTHEINTPLTYIKGNFEMINYDIEDLPHSNLRTRMLDDSKKVMDGINRLSNIVESMREMSQKSKEIKENTNIYHTLVTALTLLYNRSKQISNIKLNGEDFVIGMDKNKERYVSCIQKQRVEQTWVVIINNALDELVKIEDFEDRLIDINISCTKDQKSIVVKIKDNAGGIPKKMLNNIFEPFVSNKESSGMGVGLNVAKRIINDQKGEILAYNENGGAVFEVKLDCGRCHI